MSNLSKNVSSMVPQFNRQTRVLPAGKSVEARSTQGWSPLVGQDATGTGTLVNTQRRALLSPVIARMYDHWMQMNPKHGFAVIGHGVRLVRDSVEGHGSPCFITATDAGLGRVYVFRAGTADRVRKAFENEGIELSSIQMEEKGKEPGCTITLPQDAEAEPIFKALNALGGTSRGPLGYNATMGMAADLEAFDPSGIQLPDDTPEAPDAKKADSGDGEKRGRGRPKGSKDKGERKPRSKKVEEAVTVEAEERQEGEAAAG